jgi:DNA-binding NarL/FixJ family response regulator
MVAKRDRLIAQLHGDGKTQADIAAQLEVTQGTVSNVIGSGIKSRSTAEIDRPDPPRPKLPEVETPARVLESRAAGTPRIVEWLWFSNSLSPQPPCHNTTWARMTSQADPRPVVIVVEDEFLIRLAVVEVLAEEGFVAIEAGHAEEALATLNLRAADIHVLFTDIHMPGAMDGLALAHHARQSWPWIALLITSATTPKTALPAGSRFLPKPYALRHAVIHVRELLA